jgi:hypothetical protein
VNLRRALIATALGLAIVAGLTACETKVGQAASVNDVRLTNSDLNSFVKPGSGTYTDSSGQTVVPKQSALSVWIQVALLDRAIDAHGGPRTEQETAAARTAVLGQGSIAEAEKSVETQGYTSALGDLYVDREAALVVLYQRLKKGTTAQQALTALSTSQANTALIDAINSTHPVVTVSPRYGEWDENQLSLSTDPTAGLPSFVQATQAAAPVG